MTELILMLILTPLLAFLGAYLANRLYHQRKWTISLDEEKKEITLESKDKSKQKTEYISEPTQQDLDDLNRPSFLERMIHKTNKDRGGQPPEEEDE